MALPPNQMPPSTRTPVIGNSMQRLSAHKANQGIPSNLQSVQPMQGTGIPVFVPEQTPPPSKSSLYDDLQKVAKLAAADLAERSISPSIVAEAEAEAEQTKRIELAQQQEQQDLLQRTAMQNVIMQGLREKSQSSPLALAAEGGLIAVATGGEFAGRVPGKGHGMEDNVRMPIKEKGKQVAELAVSPSEYVVDSHTMAALGNGNADRGADVMDETVKQIRQKAYGSDKQPREISGLAALKPLIERV